MRAPTTATMFALCVVACLLSGTVQQAAAAAQEMAMTTASPLLAYPWMPWKDESGVWQKAAEANPDFSKMTLTDLPAPELYLQVALTSPYPVPQVPLNLIVNNTIAQINHIKLPAAAKDWVQMAGNAGTYVAKSMPTFMQTALQTVMEGLQVNGAPLSQLPALKDTPLDAAKALRALPQLLNITMAGLELNKLSGLAEQLHIKLPTMTSEFNETLDDLKKIPQLLQIPKEGLTLDDLKRLPAVLEQVASTASNAAEAFAKQLQAIQLPRLEDIFDADNAVSLRSFIEKQINIELPRSGPVEQVLLNVTKAIPAVAQQLGIKVEGLDKLPGVLEALDNAFHMARKEGLVVTDDAGRIDVAASLATLPDKVPLMQKVVSNIVPPPADINNVQASLERLQKSLTRLSEISGAILAPARRGSLRQRQA